jgi:hypothetical protein
MGSGYGFQLEDALFGAAGYGTGDSGGYGDMPYGGSMPAPVEIPVVNIGSDDPTQENNKRAGETVHQRSGITIGVRTFASRNHWRFAYDSLTTAEVSTFQTFFEARTFRLIPDITGENVFFRVRWISNKFRPESLRGGMWRLEFEIEEIL